MKKLLVSLFALGAVSMAILPAAEAASCTTSCYGSGSYRTCTTYCY